MAIATCLPPAATVFVALTAVASSACATHYGAHRYPPPPSDRVYRVDARAFDIGYRSGYDDGIRDARRRRPVDYARHGDYRRADRGYGGYGHPDVYRRAFRDGFISGYHDGYRHYARGGRHDRGDGGHRGYDYPAPPRHDGRNRDPDIRWGRDVRSPAADNGYRDGYAQGRDDARDGDRFDPVRASRYRSGDPGYDRRYGPRDDYKRDYRAAFQDGYAQGYRSVWRR